MPAYIIRWPDGDVSITVAQTQGEALAQLDEMGAAASTHVHRLDNCSLHFKPINNGQAYVLSLEFEETAEEVRCFFYPNIEAELEAAEAEMKAAAAIEAQDRERTRLRLVPPATPPHTES